MHIAHPPQLKLHFFIQETFISLHLHSFKTFTLTAICITLFTCATVHVKYITTVNFHPTIHQHSIRINVTVMEQSIKVNSVVECYNRFFLKRSRTHFLNGRQRLNDKIADNQETVSAVAFSLLLSLTVHSQYLRPRTLRHF